MNARRLEQQAARCDQSLKSVALDGLQCMRPGIFYLERFQFSLKQGYRQCPEGAEGVAGYWRSNINWKRFRATNFHYSTLRRATRSPVTAIRPSFRAVAAVRISLSKPSVF